MRVIHIENRLSTKGKPVENCEFALDQQVLCRWRAPCLALDIKSPGILGHPCGSVQQGGSVNNCGEYCRHGLPTMSLRRYSIELFLHPVYNGGGDLPGEVYGEGPVTRL